MKLLEQALDYVTKHDGVWCATAREIADWYYRHYYDKVTAWLATVPQGESAESGR